MNVTPIFRWSGEYFGHITNGLLFDNGGNYRGWVEGVEVWRGDGTYLGEITEANYILRREIMIPPLNKIPRIPPIPPLPPLPPLDRLPRLPLMGRLDALNNLDN